MELPLHPYRCICGAEFRIDPFHIGRMVHCPRCRNFVVVPLEEEEVAQRVNWRFSTQRIRLRPALRSDWREIQEIHSDERNYRFETSRPTTPQETKAELKRISFPKGFAKSNRLKLLIESSSDGALLGTLGVGFAFPNYSAYFGIMMANDHQGKGYGTEAVSALVRFLFDELRVERVLAMCDSLNAACRRMLEKSGFELEGTSRRYFYNEKHGWVDALSFAIIRDDEG